MRRRAQQLPSSFKILKNFFKSLKSRLKWRFASLPIRDKLIIIIGIIVISMLSILSFTFYQNGRKALQDRLAQSCELSLTHIAGAIKDHLIRYYKEDADLNERSKELAPIRLEIQTVSGGEGKIDGLTYAMVVDRSGVIIAHSNVSFINAKVPKEDSLFFCQLQDNFIRQDARVIEHIRPLHGKRSNDELIYLGVAILGFSKKTVMAPITHATETLISATLIVLIISVLLIFFVAHRMTRQIEELGNGVRRISEGDLKKEIPIMSNDELGKLAREFNTMIKHLHEKLYMQKFVSKYTVKMIRDRYSNGLPLEGESRNVALLFSDIRNFSNLTERLSPKDIVELVNIYLDEQAQIIENNHGVVDKFMGDQVMAIFEGENQADNAVKTAVEIQRKIQQLNDNRAKIGALTLTVGIGINVGPAILGNMGSKNRLDYTVIGDVVNLSARLCAIAKPGQIIAPIEVAQRLKGNYPTTQLDPIFVKGRSKPVATFEVDHNHAIIM